MTLRLGVLIAALLLPSPGPAGEVTPERLLRAAEEPQNWLMNLGGYDGSRYSGLSRIDRENVGRLVVRYSMPLGGVVEGGGNYARALPFSPLVEDGFIFIVDGWSRVSKLDARNAGAIAWQSDAGQYNLDAWLQASRGIALYRNAVIVAAADGQVHWLDAGTGEMIRSVQVGDPSAGYTIVAPPLVVGDTIIVGGGGASRGARGQIDALDALTGRPLWRSHVVPAPGEPWAETWSEPGDSWRSGGGTFSQTGTYDPATGLTVWNAGPPRLEHGSSAMRPDEHRLTGSMIALDAATGEIRWHFQRQPMEMNGISAPGSGQIVRLDGDGAGAAVASHVGSDGLFYVVGAADGALRSATPYIDDDDAAADARRAHWADTPGCPNIRGGAGFASAFSHRTGLVYGAGADGCRPGVGAARTASNSGWLGAYYTGAANAIGMMAALDPATGEVAARRMFDFPLHAGVLATAGGLVFTTTAEGTLHALDDVTLETVWSQKFATLSPIPPFTFAVDSEQFIGIVVGGNALARDLSYRPEEMGITETLFVLLVLGLPR